MPSTSLACIRVGAGRLRFSSPGRGRTSLPGAFASGPGVTLSNTGRHGERAHCRRYARHRESRRPSVETRAERVVLA